jgi:putative mRNA 3-end processing factor
VLTLHPQGLYCPAGDFYIDPSGPVKRAVITHAHGDHARSGCVSYLAHRASVPVLRHRLGHGIQIQALEYGETVQERGVKISMHPAGHIPGSAQIRIEVEGEVWVVSGDYKTEADKLCEPFEPVRCNTFISEATFGLPIYHWQPFEKIFAEINAWWRENAELGRASVMQVYSLGKAQRILAYADQSIGPVVAHPIIHVTSRAVEAGGTPLPPLLLASKDMPREAMRKALVLAPPSARASGWLKSMPHPSIANASGWMAVKKLRERAGVDRAFVLSDHADWDGLRDAIRATRAERVLLTHGYSSQLARSLTEEGLQGEVLERALSQSVAGQGYALERGEESE